MLSLEILRILNTIAAKFLFLRRFTLKEALSDLRQFWATERRLKTMKNTF